MTATGAKIVLDVSNTDPTQHNFTLGDLEISKNIPPDTSTLIRFTAPNRVATGSTANTTSRRCRAG